jgi:3-oxoacyl-[acyl-carrier-protein] synthase II
MEQEWVARYELPVTFAGQAKINAADVLTLQEIKRLDPSSQFALISAREAWADAGITEFDPERLSVEFATGIGGVWTLLDAFETLKEKGPRRVLPMTVPMLMPNGPAAAIGMDISARGGVRTSVSACASGTEAIANAITRLRSGEIDIVVAGGCEAAMHPLPIAAFASMHALSRRNEEPARASRPYDINRDGFVMGEGAGALVLETEEHALARGAKIYAELAGGYVTSDAHHITAPDPEGAAAARAVIGALKMANAEVTDVNHINAHATSTPVGDIAEYTALKRVFGDHLKNIAVSATKSSTGHLLGGAGAIETIACILAVDKGIIPPTINHTTDDPAFDTRLNLTFNKAQHREVRAALSNTFGFGGHNASVIIKKFTE